ncbi:hypothetical protein DFJ77DRAFT_438060 [Powellomyces hirtus]|nr:hypothetical protein DFJ77DRAFT_438060 [Powellomyces hirtus]
MVSAKLVTSLFVLLASTLGTSSHSPVLEITQKKRPLLIALPFPYIALAAPATPPTSDDSSILKDMPTPGIRYVGKGEACNVKDHLGKRLVCRTMLACGPNNVCEHKRQQ